MILFLGKEEFHCSFLGAKVLRDKVTKVYIEDAQYSASFFVLGLSIETHCNASFFQENAPEKLNNYR